MPTCPNCNYELVLLSSRLKYKCPLCSKLYSKKLIENKTFRIWNKKQKEQDLHNLQLEIKQRKESLQERKILKSLKLLFKEKRHYNKLTPEEKEQRIKNYSKWYYHKNKEKLLEQDDKWRQANPEKYSLTNKRWLAKNKDKRRNFLKAYRIRNLSLEQQNLRLAHWRRKQKALADTYLKNTDYNPSTIRFFPFSPTFTLCELLAK